MGDFFKGIAGWERHGDEMFLRLNLSEPRLTRVWPGAPSVVRPEGETRLLTQMVLSRSDVRKAVTDREFALSCGYSADDLALLRRALGEKPQPPKRRNVTERPRPFS